MFTGIIQAVGEVRRLEPRGGDVRIVVDAGKLEMAGLAVGHSVAVNGVCLTAILVDASGFAADVSRETLGLTTLGGLNPGSRVNLEKALTLATPLGGHLVSGHVDGIGRVLTRADDARSVRLRIEAPTELARYIAHKGSMCIDGTSLTVNRVEGRAFEVNIVRGYGPGTSVNLEVDLIARYLERLILGERAADSNTSGITAAFLAEHGFLK
jgi:riboflavin synthase